LTIASVAMGFEDSMALADGALFEEMGALITIGAQTISAIRQPSEATSMAADGGFAKDQTARFEISMEDFVTKAVKLGQKVAQGAEQWRIASLRHKGGTMELVCMATGGQSGRAEF
jgi:hypothetical protein